MPASSRRRGLRCPPFSLRWPAPQRPCRLGCDFGDESDSVSARLAGRLLTATAASTSAKCLAIAASTALDAHDDGAFAGEYRRSFVHGHSLVRSHHRSRNRTTFHSSVFQQRQKIIQTLTGYYRPHLPSNHHGADAFHARLSLDWTSLHAIYVDTATRLKQRRQQSSNCRSIPSSWSV